MSARRARELAVPALLLHEVLLQLCQVVPNLLEVVPVEGLLRVDALLSQVLVRVQEVLELLVRQLLVALHELDRISVAQHALLRGKARPHGLDHLSPVSKQDRVDQLVLLELLGRVQGGSHRRVVGLRDELFV